MIIEKANAQDHLELSVLTKLSKAFWGYSDVQMATWNTDLTLTPQYFEEFQVYKMCDSETIIAYYSFAFEDQKTIKLDNFFVHPAWIGKGHGKKLMRHFLEVVGQLERNRVLLDADPNSEAFYLKFGFQIIGKLKTSIPQRFLPIMELKL